MMVKKGEMREDAQGLVLDLIGRALISSLWNAFFAVFVDILCQVEQIFFNSGIRIHETFYSRECRVLLVLYCVVLLPMFFFSYPCKETNLLVYPFWDLKVHFIPGNILFDKSVFLPTSGFFFFSSLYNFWTIFAFSLYLVIP